VKKILGKGSQRSQSSTRQTPRFFLQSRETRTKKKIGPQSREKNSNFSGPLARRSETPRKGVHRLEDTERPKMGNQTAKNCQRKGRRTNDPKQRLVENKYKKRKLSGRALKKEAEDIGAFNVVELGTLGTSKPRASTRTGCGVEEKHPGNCSRHVGPGTNVKEHPEGASGKKVVGADTMKENDTSAFQTTSRTRSDPSTQ